MIDCVDFDFRIGLLQIEQQLRLNLSEKIICKIVSEDKLLPSKITELSRMVMRRLNDEFGFPGAGFAALENMLKLELTPNSPDNILTLDSAEGLLLEDPILRIVRLVRGGIANYKPLLVRILDRERVQLSEFSPPMTSSEVAALLIVQSACRFVDENVHQTCQYVRIDFSSLDRAAQIIEDWLGFVNEAPTEAPGELLDQRDRA